MPALVPNKIAGNATVQSAWFDSDFAAVLCGYSVLGYGAKGDDATDDSGAIQALINNVAAGGGGVVYMPPTGHAYLLNTGLTVPAGVTLLGCGAKNNMRGAVGQGTTGAAPSSPRTLVNRGSWIRSTDTNFPAVELVGTTRTVAGGNGSGQGATIRGINFIYDQNTDVVNWTPRVYPYAIHATDQFQTIDDILIIGASHGIHIDGFNVLGVGPTGFGGTGCSISNIFLSCFNVGLRVEGVVDTIRFLNITMECLYSTNQIIYSINNFIGFDFIRCDNPWLSNIQVFEARSAFRFTNDTASASAGHTGRSMTNAMWNNIQINLCYEAFTANGVNVFMNLVMASSLISNTPLQFVTGQATPSSAYLFNLPSNNIQLTFSSCIFVAGKGFLSIGNGSVSTEIGGAPSATFSSCQILYNGDGGNVTGFSVPANTTVRASSCNFSGGNHTIKSGAGNFYIPQEDFIENYSVFGVGDTQHKNLS